MLGASWGHWSHHRVAHGHWPHAGFPKCCGSVAGHVPRGVRWQMAGGWSKIPMGMGQVSYEITMCRGNLETRNSYLIRVLRVLRVPGFWQISAITDNHIMKMAKFVVSFFSFGWNQAVDGMGFSADRPWQKASKNYCNPPQEVRTVRSPDWTWLVNWDFSASPLGVAYGFSYFSLWGFNGIQNQISPGVGRLDTFHVLCGHGLLVQVWPLDTTGRQGKQIIQQLLFNHQTWNCKLM